MIENGLLDRLSNYTNLTDLVSTNIYASHIPQKSTLPCVAYRKNSSRPKMLLATDTDVFETDFDVGCFSKDYDEANAIAEQVIAALQRYSGTNDSVVIMDGVIRDIGNDYETELEIYEVEINILITHRGL